MRVDSSQQAIRKRARLLLAEDNPLNQLVMLRYLHALGYDRANVCVVADGQAALEAVKSREIDVVLMVSAPNMRFLLAFCRCSSLVFVI
jgi:CheY-like chemotaxis protein